MMKIQDIPVYKKEFIALVQIFIKGRKKKRKDNIDTFMFNKIHVRITTLQR